MVRLGKTLELRHRPAKCVGFFYLAGAVVGMVSGCSGPLTDDADAALLASLREDGVSGYPIDVLDQRLDKALHMDKASRNIADTFGKAQPSAGKGVPLTEIVSAALERNPGIGQAAQEINRSDALHLNAVLGYLPQVTATYNFNHMNEEVVESDNAVYQSGSASYPIDGAFAEMNQPIFDLGRIYGIKYAMNARTQAEVDYVVAVRSALYEVFDQYITAVQTKLRARSLRERQEFLVRKIAGQGTLSETGLADDIKLASLRSERETLGSEESMENAEYQTALGNLSAMSGLVVADVAPFPFPSRVLGTETTLDPDEAVERGLVNNSEIMSAALRVVGSKVLRDQAWLEDFAPVLKAYSVLDWESREASRFGGGSTTQSATVGVRLTVPIFNPKGNGYKHLPLQGETRSQALSYHAKRREIETNIRTSLSRMKQLAAAIRQASTAEREARRALSIERNRQRTGESVDLVVASREVRLNIVAEKRGYYQLEYLRAWVRLQHMMGEDLSKVQM